MASLREGQDVLVRFGMAVASPYQINEGALHGPRVWEISHHAVFMSTRGHSTSGETLSPDVSLSTGFFLTSKHNPQVNNAFVMLNINLLTF